MPKLIPGAGQTGMACTCGGKLRVIDTDAIEPDRVIRVRKCDRCGLKFMTEEVRPLVPAEAWEKVWVRSAGTTKREG